MSPIIWSDKLRHLLHTMAFCLTISAVQYAFAPDKPYEIALVYSLSIGLLSWLFIDFGCHLVSADGMGWPRGVAGVLLPVAGIAMAYLAGTLVADRWLGLSSWDAAARPQLRMSLLISALAGLCVTYYFYSRGKAHWLQAQMREVHQQANEARLKLLESQLEPHMLFKSLANLRVLITTDPGRAQEMLDRMVAYLRATLSASRSTLHPLSDEFDRLHDYLELLTVRMGPRLRYTLDLPTSLRDLPVPPLLLQPLVENAIRHGLEPQIGGGHITVRARSPGPASHGATADATAQSFGAEAPEGCVQLCVIDTGVGLPTGAHALPAAPGQHFGLTQVRERLHTLYGPHATLKLIANKPVGTLTCVALPLKTAFHDPSEPAHRPDR